MSTIVRNRHSADIMTNENDHKFSKFMSITTTISSHAKLIHLGGDSNGVNTKNTNVHSKGVSTKNKQLTCPTLLPTEKHLELYQWIDPLPSLPPSYLQCNPNSFKENVTFPIFESVHNPLVNNDMPPSYKPSIESLTVVSLRTENMTPFDRVMFRHWKHYIMELNSTQLNFYHLDKELIKNIVDYTDGKEDSCELREREINRNYKSPFVTRGTWIIKNNKRVYVTEKEWNNSYNKNKKNNVNNISSNETDDTISNLNVFLSNLNNKKDFQMSKKDTKNIVKKVLTDPSKYLTNEKLCKSFSLQNGEFGIAADIEEKPYVLRIRCEMEQFLLNFSNVIDMINWSVYLSIGIGISTDIDQREYPTYKIVPVGTGRTRRRRRRIRRRERDLQQSGNAQVTQVTEVTQVTQDTQSTQNRQRVSVHSNSESSHQVGISHSAQPTSNDTSQRSQDRETRRIMEKYTSNTLRRVLAEDDHTDDEDAENHNLYSTNKTKKTSKSQSTDNSKNKTHRRSSFGLFSSSNKKNSTTNDSTSSVKNFTNPVTKLLGKRFSAGKNSNTDNAAQRSKSVSIKTEKAFAHSISMDTIVHSNPSERRPSILSKRETLSVSPPSPTFLNEVSQATASNLNSNSTSNLDSNSDSCISLNHGSQQIATPLSSLENTSFDHQGVAPETHDKINSLTVQDTTTIKHEEDVNVVTLQNITLYDGPAISEVENCILEEQELDALPESATESIELRLNQRYSISSDENDNLHNADTTSAPNTDNSNTNAHDHGQSLNMVEREYTMESYIELEDEEDYDDVSFEERPIMSVYENEGILHDESGYEIYYVNDRRDSTTSTSSSTWGSGYRRRTYSVTSNLGSIPYGSDSVKWSPPRKVMTKKKYIREAIGCIKPLLETTPWFGKVLCTPCLAPEFETNNPPISGVLEELQKVDASTSSIFKFRNSSSEPKKPRRSKLILRKCKNHYLKQSVVGPGGYVKI